MATYTNDQRPSCLVPGDHVEFIVDHTTYKYTYQYSTHLTGKDIPNDTIFNILNCDKKAVCDQLYGYTSKIGISTSSNWPECHRDDHAAITRVVNFLYDRIDDGPKNEKATVAFRKFTFVLTDGSSVAAEVWQSVPNFMNFNRSNDCLFTHLGISYKQRKAWAYMCYGYPAGDGLWPICKVGDRKALERFCVSIQNVLNWARQQRQGTGKMPSADEIWSYIQLNQSIATPESTKIDVKPKTTSDGKIIKITAVTPTIRRGEKRTGCTIRGKASRTSTSLGHLSNRKVTG